MDENYIEVEVSTVGSFAIVFTCFFSLAGAYMAFTEKSVLALLFFGLGLTVFSIWRLKPELLVRPNDLWHEFGLLLSKVVGPLVMGVVYLLAIVPIGGIMRLRGRDALTLKPRNERSYWQLRHEVPESMDRQF